MDHKIIVAATLALIFQTCFADICPSVSDIKNNSLKTWKLYDSDDGTPLSLEREAEFKKYAERFAMAEWSNKNNKHGTIHCYYRDKSGSDLEAYIAKDNYAPKLAASYWYDVSGYRQCAAGMDKCEFESIPQQEAKLATK